jgi:hypothetical protein
MRQGVAVLHRSRQLWRAALPGFTAKAAKWQQTDKAFLIAKPMRKAANRQGFSHREADEKSRLDEAIRRGMGGAWRCEWSW